MGSNQQRQAVPLIKTKAPVVGTGMEEIVAKNSGQVIDAEEDGTVNANGDEVMVNTVKEHNYLPSTALCS